MKLPSFRTRKTADEPVSNERIFAEARELAQSRLEQYMADLHDRLLTPADKDDQGRSARDEMGKAAA